MSDDGSTIDLRNILPANAGVAAPATATPVSTSGATAGNPPVPPATDDTVIMPLVSQKVADEFGLDAEKVTELGQKYSIPETVKNTFPDLVALLIKTESMNDEERDYWFQVIPIMSEEQIIKLRTILVNEREQLKKIDEEYEGEMQKLGESHKSDWNAFEAQQKKAAIVHAESQHEEAEEHHEADLLRKLEET